MDNIGNKIKEQREKMSMTQQQVADILKKDKSSISKIENGVGNNQIQTIKDIADALGCEMTIQLFEKNIGTELLNCTSIINEKDFELDITEQAQYIHEEIQKSINDIVSKGENSIWDMFHGPRYRGIFLAEVQNILIKELLLINLDNLTENKTILIHSNNDYEGLIADAFMLLKYEEKAYDDYGFENSWSLLGIAEACLIRGCYGYVSFSKSFLQRSDKKEILESILNDNINKIKRTEMYIDMHHNGFPFICCLVDRGDESNEIRFQYLNDEINIFPGKLIYAWSQDEAVEQYLITATDDEMMYYFSDYLIDDIIDNIYYDEMDYDKLTNGKEIKRVFDDIKKHISTNNRFKFEACAKELLTVEMLFDILGKDNLIKLFVNKNKNYVSCFLSADDEEIYDFIM